jgi:alanyl-tRNA synthetase
MEPTQKLYFRDSSLLEFSATVLDVQPRDAGASVIVDQTAFYPTGGGQPNDTGTLEGSRVVDVFEDDAGLIHHFLEEPGQIKAGDKVSGLVDRARRLDHLQQHSGQHILSQAFVQACGAETRSFHLSAQTSTIDIDLDSPSNTHMRAAEDIANAIIFEDRPMRVHLVDEEEASRLPLRKESAVQGEIRVIEIENFDWSPCGGTHAARTGQIGLIAILSNAPRDSRELNSFAVAERWRTTGLRTRLHWPWRANSAPIGIHRRRWSNARFRKAKRQRNGSENCWTWR